MPHSPSPGSYRFGPFELDARAYQLRRDGRPVRLERRPMDLLLLFIERRSELVTRREIAERLWAEDVFVEVEAAVNTVVWKLRTALRDSIDTPRYIETVPGRGYRFIAPVEVVPDPRAGQLSPEVSPEVEQPPSPSNGSDAAASGPSSGPGEPAEPVHPSQGRWGAPAARHVIAALLAIAAMSTWAWMSGGARRDAVTIAVLPFVNSTDQADDYVAAGLTEETAAALSQVDPRRMSVLAPESVLAYLEGGKPRAELGRQLGVDYYVEAEVAAGSDRVELTSRLLDATGGTEIWSSTYERERADVRALGRELTAAIAARIGVDAAPVRESAGDLRQTRNPDAFEAYLRARYFQNQRNRESTARAIQYYEQAVALDPDYALAWAALSFTHAASTINSDIDPGAVSAAARAAAESAMRANGELAEAQFAYGYLHWMLDWNWPRAESAFRRAIARDSSLVPAHWALGHVLSQMGRHGEAEEVIARARTLDPLGPMTHALSAQLAFQRRDIAAATAHAKRATLLNSQFWIGYMQLAQAYAQGGEIDLALEALEDAARFSGGENSKTLSLRGYLMGRLGRAVEAGEALEALEAASTSRYVPPYGMALVYAGLENRTAMYEWLEKAVAARDVNLIFLPADSKWDPYRQEARFTSLLTQCRFAPGEPPGR